MAKETSRPISSLLFYTHNVARALKPSADGELAHAIHETLHFALDGEPQDYLIDETNAFPCPESQAHEASTSAVSLDGPSEEEENIRPGFFPTADNQRPYVSYAWEEDSGVLVLPHPRTVLNPTVVDPCTSIEHGTGNREAFDVTAKIFFLADGEQDSYSQAWVEQALQRFTKATGLDSVDTLILAFGEINEETKGLSQKISKVATLWCSLSPDKQIHSLGLSDFSKSTLEALLTEIKLGPCLHSKAAKANDSSTKSSSAKADMTTQVQEAMTSNADSVLSEKPSSHVHIPSSPSQVSYRELADEGDSIVKEYGPSSCRRPRLCTINLRDESSLQNTQKASTVNGSSNQGSCCWDRDLASYCKQNDILLVAHNDRKNILPSRTLPTLMTEFENKMPYPLPAGKRLRPLWCLKYTVLIRDRAVLADKGFILYAQVVDA